MKYIQLLLLLFSIQSWSLLHATDPDNQLHELLYPSIPNNVGSKIKHGMSENDIFKLMNSSGKHQFFTTYSNVQARCVEYVHPNCYAGFYFVFTNSVLAFVCSPPEYDFIDIYDKKGNYVYTKADLSDPQKRIRDVFNSEDLLLQKDFEVLMRPPEKPKQSIDWGLTIAYLAVSPLKLLAKKEKSKIDYIQLARKHIFLLSKISINMKRDEIESLFGKPKMIHANHHETFYFYGDQAKLANEYAYFYWVSITYVKDRVTNIFSSDFLDKGEIDSHLLKSTF